MVSRCVSPYHSWSHESARYSLLLRHAKVWNLASSPQMAPGRAEMTMFHVSIPIGSMVLVYMLTWLGYIDGIHVTIYSIHGSYGYYNYIIHGTHIFFEWPSKLLRPFEFPGCVLWCFWRLGFWTDRHRGIAARLVRVLPRFTAKICRPGRFSLVRAMQIWLPWRWTKRRAARGLVGYGEWDSHRIGHVQYSTIPLELCMFISFGFLWLFISLLCKNGLFIDIHRWFIKDGDVPYLCWKTKG